MNKKRYHSVKMRSLYFFVILIVNCESKSSVLNLSVEEFDSCGFNELNIALRNPTIRLNCINFNTDIVRTDVSTLISNVYALFPVTQIHPNGSQCNGQIIVSDSEAFVSNVIQNISLRWDQEIFVQTQIPIQRFDAKMFGDASVFIASKNLSYELSPSFLEAREFSRRNRNGKKLQDFEGRHLKVATHFYPPFSYPPHIDGKEKFDGIEAKLFLIMAEKLNFTYEIKTPKTVEKFGVYRNGAWHDGIIGMVVDREVDLAFGAIWLKANVLKHASCSHPWTELCITMLVPRPTLLNTKWRILKPFSIQIWICYGLSVVSLWLVLFVKGKLNVREDSDAFSSSWALLEVIGSTTGAWMPSGNMTNAGGLLMFWSSLNLLLLATYNSSLAARLASPSFTNRLNNIQDLVEHNISWGRMSPPPHLEDMFNFQDPYDYAFASRYIQESSEGERHERLSTGKYAIYGLKLSKHFFPDTEVLAEDLNDLRVMKTCAGNLYSSFVMPAASPLLPVIDRMMLRLSASGLIRIAESDVMHRHIDRFLHEVSEEHDRFDGQPHVLELKKLTGAFTLLLVGLQLCIAIFFLEIVTARECKRAPRQEGSHS